MAEAFSARRNRRPHSFDEPAPTVQRFGIADERPTSLVFSDDGQAPAEPDAGKPPYRVPLLAEIQAVDKTGLTVMSTFSGAGGSCLGFEWAGYRPLLAVEFIPAAVETYELNHPGVPVYSDDIRSLSAKKALEIMGVAKGELDVLEGSPPCESFSTAGKRSEGWGKDRAYSDGTSQVMDDLFFEFTRLLGGIKPRAFVAENVAGLVKGVSKGYFKRIHAELSRQGYRVEARLLDAQWLGVPQRRQRVIFVGVRRDLKMDPAFPPPLQYRYSIRDALAGIARVRYDNGGSFTNSREELDVDAPIRTITNGVEGLNSHHFKVEDELTIEKIVYDNGGVGGAERSGRDEEDLDAPARTITNSHAAATHFKVDRAKRDADQVEHGQALSAAAAERWSGLAPGQGHDKHFSLVRADADAPSPTIVKEDGRMPHAVSHPDDPRKFSIPELRRLCGFPDDFVLTGSYAQQWERLGNSVPPPMMFHVASALRDRVLLPARSAPPAPRRARRSTSGSRRKGAAAPPA